jgi:hypothetical protein
MMKYSPDAATAASDLDSVSGGRAHLAGRSDQLVRRIATHESGHCLVARALGSVVELVTIVPEAGFEGLCRRHCAATAASLQLRASSSEAINILEVAARLSSPEIGEARVKISEGVVRAETLIIELVAGTIGEMVAMPDLEPLSAEHDLIEARALAGVVSFAAESLLEFCKAEARAILVGNIDVHEALADQLAEYGELSGDQVDEIIASAIAQRQVRIEHQRREDWRKRETNASSFQCERLR